MTLATEGPLLIALDAARRTLADTGQWSEIADLSRIHYDALPAPEPGPDYTRQQLIAARPFALLWHEVSGGFRLEAQTADLRCPISSGKIICQIEVNVPPDIADNPTAVATWAMRLIGRLLRTDDDDEPGIWDLANTPGYLPVRAIDVDAYVRTGEKEIRDVGDAILFEFCLTWGGR